MMRIVLSLTIIAALSLPTLQAKEKLKVLSTIKPIHSLVTAIAGDTADAQLIVDSYASPHHYSLKPSDLRKIGAADLIFRIDKNLERFLEKSLRSVPANKVISLADTEKLTVLEVSEGRHDHDHSADHDDEKEPSPELDYHLWLSPDNAIAMAHIIRDTLVSATPDAEALLTDNTQQLVDNIKQTNLEITKQLEAVKSTPFMVTHDAWQYFTKHYELNQIGSVSAQEHLKASAKSISKARKAIKLGNVKCLVSEPTLKKKTLRVLTEGLSVAIAEIDPLGRAIPESASAYPQLLQYTADKLLNCLTDTAKNK